MKSLDGTLFLKILPTCRILTGVQSVRLQSKAVDFIRPETIPVEEWKKLLWVAMDLKKVVRTHNKECLNLLRQKHVTILFEKPHGRFQMAFTLACSILGARCTSYFESQFENQESPSDLGRALAQMTDMFIVHGIHHDSLVKFSSRANVPLFPASCNIYCLQKVLSDLMTILEKFHRLKGLTLTWIGPPLPIFNTYLLLCPLFGMKIHYLCICIYGSGKMSPIKKGTPLKACKLVKDGIVEFKCVKEAVSECDVIATSIHPEEKNQINLDALKSLSHTWILLHTLPRSSVEVSDDIFNHENNLSWKASGNYLYIAMAVILTNLSDYRPIMNMPDFEGTLKNV